MKCADEKAFAERYKLADTMVARLCDECRAEFDRFYWNDTDFTAVSTAVTLNAIELERAISVWDVEAQNACLAVRTQAKRDLVALCDKWLSADTKETK